jgi:hypothetical protein
MACACERMSVPMYARTRACTYMCTYVYTCICARMCARMYARMYVRMPTCTYIRSYVEIDLSTDDSLVHVLCV